jgi:MFS family permease
LNTRLFSVSRGTFRSILTALCQNPAPMISLARYARLLALPHLKATIATSVIGRLPIGIAGLAVLLLSQEQSGSFARAGGTTAAYVAGLATVAPFIGRLIDRRGPRVLLRACAVLYPSALLGLAAAIVGGSPLWLVLPLAASAGASLPPITVCMRTLLKRRLGDDALLATAYSLESVLIETLFVAGPMLVAALVALGSTVAAVAFAALSSATGTLLFLRTPPLLDWHIEARRTSGVFGPLGDPRFLRLLGVVLCYSMAFGLVEIGTTAFASEAHAPASAGLLLGLMSIGSVLGGLAYGSRTWRKPLRFQFAFVLAVMGVGIAPLAGTTALWLFAVLVVVAGTVMAPALTIQSMLVAKAAPPEHATEAFTWSSTFLLAGIALGIATGGVLLESGSSRLVLAAASAAALAGAAGAGLGLRLFHQ